MRECRHTSNTKWGGWFGAWGAWELGLGGGQAGGAGGGGKERRAGLPERGIHENVCIGCCCCWWFFFSFLFIQSCFLPGSLPDPPFSPFPMPSPVPQQGWPWQRFPHCVSLGFHGQLEEQPQLLALAAGSYKWPLSEKAPEGGSRCAGEWAWSDPYCQPPGRGGGAGCAAFCPPTWPLSPLPLSPGCCAL